MIYEFKIVQLVKDINNTELTDVIRNVAFVCIATNELTGQTHEYHDNIKLPPPNSTNFVDLSQLTEAQVVSWVKSLVDMQHIEQVCTARMNMTPGDGLTVPWGSQSHNDGGN